MSFRQVATLALCLYLPLAWADSFLAVAHYSLPADLASLLLVSAAATIVLAAVLWAGIAGVVALVTAVYGGIGRQRLAAGILAVFVAMLFALALSKWLAGFGIHAPRRVTVPVLVLICIGMGVARPDTHVRALERTAWNAWQVMRFPLMLTGVACIAVAGFGSWHDTAVRGGASWAIGMEPRRSILLVTIDTFSASRSNVYGAKDLTTPFLQRFASESVVFDQAIATSNFTAPTVASIHTGQYPWTHRIVGQQSYFRARPSTMASVLNDNGYRTAFFNANWWGDPRHNRSQSGWSEVTGPYQAVPTPRWKAVCPLPVCDTVRLAAVPPFSHLVALIEIGLQKGGWLEGVYYPPRPVFDDARKWISANTQADKPVFVWVHIFGPHDPYLSPKPFLYSMLGTDELDTIAELKSQPLYMFSDTSRDQVGKLEARYKEMLRYVDSALADFFADPAVARFAANSVVVITSDHGESFERNFLGHTGPLLTQSLIRVPMLIRAPGLPAGMRVEYPVSQTDILPTVLDLVGMPSPRPTAGISLVPMMKGAAYPTRHIYSMNLEQAYADRALIDQPWSIALIDWPWKFVAYNKRPGQYIELYDLGVDPGEIRNLASLNPALVKKYEQAIGHALKANE